MENMLPTADEFLQDHLEISHFYDDKTQNMVCYSDDVQKAMVEFAKLHVEAALKAASELEETDGTEGYKIYPDSILAAYSLENIVNKRVNNLKIKNGDVFDIGQTVNGVSKFMWFNKKWYYFEERMTDEYQYDQEDLTATVLNESGMEDITYLGNALSLVPGITFKSK